ncbi:MAG: hypothetical protein A2046_02680 [Bacteroidetes bacterium GWA2_30_7]|nr:MAG: hypothetical protein A2046_02680 [Bacteroidetes bacterium GWA2_30_7]
MKKKIILNYLPPADTDMPSAALSILKSFMQSNGFETEIKYWNLTLNKLLSDLDSNSTATAQVRLIPYCYYISQQHNDNDSINRIKVNLQALKPSWITTSEKNYTEWLETAKSNIYRIINQELDKIDFENVLIFGLSSKFYQWIPGIILAEEIKKRKPEIKIVIGGFESSFGAIEILKTSLHIDFAIWGEGEYPLLNLCQQIHSNIIDYNTISRLAYRNQAQNIITTHAFSQYLNFEEYLYPEYSDYVEQSGKNPSKIPINLIRGCSWKKCKFCNYSHGYKYRERTPENVLEEIQFMNEKYGTEYFIFVDNDIIGLDISRFEKMLDLLIEYLSKKNKMLTFWGEFIIHPELNMNIYKKLSLAGFSQVSAGYEAISENILKKMNKSNTLAHNILLIKGLQKAGVKCPVNLIKGVPDETEADVIQSIENLKYFRFYFSNPQFSLNHLLGFFNLKKEAKYFKQLSEEEKTKYDNNTIASNLPSDLIKDRFNLFGYNKNAVTNEKLWQYYSIIEDHYTTKKYSYKINESEGIYYYVEYCNEILLKKIIFDEQEYINTLKFCNDKVQSFENLSNHLQEKHKKISNQRIIEILQNLKQEYLLYFNNDYSTIVSIIEI